MGAPPSRLIDERQIRAALADHDRRLGQGENNDVLIGDGRRLIIRSPDGHFWNITVDNAGTVAAVDMGASI